jgi:hypothetical protein
VSELDAGERAELESLRARVAALEAERAEELARASAALAAAQERAYWLDRWHLDLNALMATAWGARLRAAMRMARAPVRRARTAKRALTRTLRGR